MNMLNSYEVSKIEESYEQATSGDGDRCWNHHRNDRVATPDTTYGNGGATHPPPQMVNGFMFPYVFSRSLNGPFLQSGSTKPTCNSGQTFCTAACTSLSSDSIHCGNCWTECNQSPFTACNNGTCGCPSGTQACPGPNNTTICSNTSTDGNNCGSCGHVCDKDLAPHCIGGVCHTCPIGMFVCCGYECYTGGCPRACP